MIAINMTEAQYDEVVVLLQHRTDVTLTLDKDDDSGHIKTSQLDADFTYNGASLSLQNVVKHGIAKFASDAAVQSHLELLLGSL